MLSGRADHCPEGGVSESNHEEALDCALSRHEKKGREINYVKHYVVITFKSLLLNSEFC